jgi:hypothetical protein
MEVRWKRELTSQYSLVTAVTPSPLVNQHGSHALPDVTPPAETLPTRGVRASQLGLGTEGQLSRSYRALSAIWTLPLDEDGIKQIETLSRDGQNPRGVAEPKAMSNPHTLTC